MKWEELLQDRALGKRLTRKILFFLTFAIALTFALFHWQGLLDILRRVLGILSPFLVGIAVAFVLNVVVKALETHVFSFLNRKNFKWWNRCRRGVCVAISFLLVFALLAGVIFYVLPELGRSVKVLTDNIPTYVNNLTAWLTEQLERFDISQVELESLKIDWSSVFQQAGEVTGSLVGGVANAAMSTFSGVVSFLMSLIFSVYMLLGKERLLRNTRRVLFAFLPKKKAARLVEVGALSNRIFSGFVTGQLTEALILGSLCYLGMSLFRFDYALLISVIICLTSLVPILGAYIGGAVGAFILLLIDPMKALWFLVFLVILQQFEGNVIYPRVVGTSIGLPGIWVLLAILIFGDLFGIPGILLGVPAASVLYTLLRSSTARRLKERGVSPGDPAPPDQTEAGPKEPPAPEQTETQPPPDGTNP